MCRKTCLHDGLIKYLQLGLIICCYYCAICVLITEGSTYFVKTFATRKKETSENLQIIKFSNRSKHVYLSDVSLCHEFTPRRKNWNIGLKYGTNIRNRVARNAIGTGKRKLRTCFFFNKRSATSLRHGLKNTTKIQMSAYNLRKIL